jgi:hypothetical protein
LHQKKSDARQEICEILEKFGDARERKPCKTPSTGGVLMHQPKSNPFSRDPIANLGQEVAARRRCPSFPAYGPFPAANLN